MSSNFLSALLVSVPKISLLTRVELMRVGMASPSDHWPFVSAI